MSYCMLILVRSGSMRVVVALLVFHASYCVSVLKEASHGFKSGDLWSSGVQKWGLGVQNLGSGSSKEHYWVNEISNQPLMSKLTSHVYSRAVSYIAYIKAMWNELVCSYVIECMLIVWFKLSLHSFTPLIYLSVLSPISCLLCVAMYIVVQVLRRSKCCCELEDDLGGFLCLFYRYRYLVGLMLWYVTSGTWYFNCFLVSSWIMLLYKYFILIR